MNRTFTTAAMASLVALLLGCPHDLTRRTWPDKQVPPDSGTDLVRDQAADLRDASSEAQVDQQVPDAGCPSPCVTTMAGHGVPGGNATPVPLSKAEFAIPQDLVVDKWDNIFVADTGNHVIRQITSKGMVSVLAGTINKAEFVNGAGTVARFSSPKGIAVDAVGVVYVADYGNNAIRKISKGEVSTVAGAGPLKSGFVDGSVSIARFDGPSGLILDSTGNKIYVADSGNNMIRIIHDAATVKTHAGNSSYCGYTEGSLLAAQLCTPNDVALHLDKLYMVEEGDTVRLIWNKKVSTLAGSTPHGYNNGPGNVAKFYNPAGVAVDLQGNILVADTNNHTIRKITPAGVVSTGAGNGLGGSFNGSGKNAQFNQPTGVAVDSNGVIYVADSQNHSIRVIK